jgi:hypothetical protein
MALAEKIITDFHSEVFFFEHHITGEKMVHIGNPPIGKVSYSITVIAAAKRIIAYKKMLNAIRKNRG